VGTDQDWEKWGATDPYFGVLSSEKFRKNKFDALAKREFFATGVQHIDRVFRLIGKDFKPKSALDFGCGVGRLVLPLAARTEQTVGVDISPSMLAEAADNAKSAGVTNVSFILVDKALTNVAGKFGLVHTYIVLQHIPWKRGRIILQHLAEKVEPGGYLAVHFLTSSAYPRLIQAAVRFRYMIPPLNWLRNAIKRRPLFEPAIQLHCYKIDTILRDLEDKGFETPVLHDDPNMANMTKFKNVFLFARRKPNTA
jgi:SAM-dependent methyltransferase